MELSGLYSRIDALTMNDELIDRQFDDDSNLSRLSSLSVTAPTLTRLPRFTSFDFTAIPSYSRLHLVTIAVATNGRRRNSALQAPFYRTIPTSQLVQKSSNPNSSPPSDHDSLNFTGFPFKTIQSHALPAILWDQQWTIHASRYVVCYGVDGIWCGVFMASFRCYP